MPVPITLSTNSGLLDVSQFVGRDWVDCINQGVAAISAGTLLVPDSIKGNATTIGNIPNGFNIVFEGVGPFGLDRLNVGSFVKIFGHGTRLVAQNINDTLINQTTQAILQTSSSFEMRGIILDGARVGQDNWALPGRWDGKRAHRGLQGFTGLNCGWRIDGAQFISASSCILLTTSRWAENLQHRERWWRNQHLRALHIRRQYGRADTQRLARRQHRQRRQPLYRVLGPQQRGRGSDFSETPTPYFVSQIRLARTKRHRWRAKSATFPLVIDRNTIPSQATKPLCFKRRRRDGKLVRF